MIMLRLAQESDAAQLAELAHVYVDAETHSNTAEGILKYLQNTDDIVLIAEDEGQLIGYCSGRINQHMSFNKPIADVLELFLMEAYRGTGIGKKLLKAMETEFLNRGVGRFRILVRQGSENARGFYKACGYEEFEMVMCRKDV